MIKVQIPTAYVFFYAVCSIVIAIPLALQLLFGLVKWSLIPIVVSGTLLCITTGLLHGVYRRTQPAFWASLTVSTLFWLLLGYQTIERIKFIIENDGMEKADGYGSPMAFLIGIVVEQLFFIPLCFIVIIGWMSVACRGKMKEGFGQ